MATNLIKYRGRNDDGNETTATWKAAENTPWTQAVDVNFRVRFKVQNSTSAINNLDVKLQYNKNGAGWLDVNAASSVVRSSASANLADQANLTEQLTGGTGTFIGATSFDEVNGSCGGTALDLTATGKMEQEYCAQVRSGDVVNGDTIQLRTINDDAEAAWTTYTVTASMTVSEAGPVEGAGSSTGVGAATATAQAIAQAAGSSVGIGGATGVGRAIATATGLAEGVSTVLGEGADASGPAIHEGAGLSVGIGDAQAGAQSINQAVGSSQGVSVDAAVAQALVLAIGSSSGLGSAAATTQVIAQVVGSAGGFAVVLGVGADGAVAAASRVLMWLRRRRRL